MVNVTIDGRTVRIEPRTYGMKDLAAHLGLDASTRAIRIDAIEFRGNSVPLRPDAPAALIGGNDSYRVNGGEAFSRVGIEDPIPGLKIR